jgi:hypothetical protein
MASYRCRLVDREALRLQGEETRPGDMWYQTLPPGEPPAQPKLHQLPSTDIPDDIESGVLRSVNQEAAWKWYWAQRDSNELQIEDYFKEVERYERRQRWRQWGGQVLMLLLPSREEYQLIPLDWDETPDTETRITGDPPAVTLREQIVTREYEGWLTDGVLSNDVIGGVFKDLFLDA